MEHKDRRRYPRYETKVGVTVLTAEMKIAAHMIDISEGGIGLVSSEAIKPNTKVHISIKLTGDYSIQGTVVWSTTFYDDGKNYYRTGIEIERVILKDIKAISFPEPSKLMMQILSEIKERGIKIVEK